MRTKLTRAGSWKNKRPATSQSIANSTYPRESFWETSSSHCTGEPWGTRDLEAKCWQIASSVKVGSSVFYCVRIICFSLRVSTEQRVNAGCFLWERETRCSAKPCSHGTFLGGFPPSLQPTLSALLCITPHAPSATYLLGNPPAASASSPPARVATKIGLLCLHKSIFWRLIHPKWMKSEQLFWCSLFSRGMKRRPCSVYLRERLANPSGKRHTDAER